MEGVVECERKEVPKEYGAAVPKLEADVLEAEVEVDKAVADPDELRVDLLVFLC